MKLSPTQIVFNKVYRHLIRQNKSSVSCGGCRYRGPGKLKCAIGVLIKDEDYDLVLEGRACDDSSVRSALEDSGVDVRDTVVMMPLLNRLQSIHDNVKPSKWPQKLRVLAKKFNLKVPG